MSYTTKMKTCLKQTGQLHTLRKNKKYSGFIFINSMIHIPIFVFVHNFFNQSKSFSISRFVNWPWAYLSIANYPFNIPKILPISLHARLFSFLSLTVFLTLKFLGFSIHDIIFFYLFKNSSSIINSVFDNTWTIHRILYNYS